MSLNQGMKSYRNGEVDTNKREMGKAKSVGLAGYLHVKLEGKTGYRKQLIYYIFNFHTPSYECNG